MPFGSVFHKFPYVSLTTADNVKIEFINNFITRLAFKILGMPHVGLRLRSRKIMQNIPNKIEKFLDAGCGTGIYSFELAGKAKNIEAVDIAQEKVDYANKVNIFKDIHFQKGDLCSIKFKDENFDLIICSDVLEHIKNHEKAFSELTRVLKKEGTLLISVPFDSKKNRIVYRKYGHERPGYNVKDMTKLCAKNKVKLIRSEGYSRDSAEVFSRLTDEKLVNNKPLLGLMFYPIYLLSILADKIFTKSEPNGIFFKIVK